MTEKRETGVAAVVWRDLTVENAEQVRDFYSKVVGWSPEPVEMDGYTDFNMKAHHGGDAVAGICHARGPNANLPAQWLMYITVENLDDSVERCVELGGQVIDGPRSLGHGRFCVIRDPAGAVVALCGS